MFPSKFTIEDNNILISFPDLPGCLSCGKTFEEAMKGAKSAMAFYLMSMKEVGKKIPNPTASKDIWLELNQIIMLIQVNIPLYIDAMADN
jgi:predicted RNase H-like HicB family nuclease